ncbi:putative HhH-GPD base excision DNA repair family protein [Hibiscus syriacus]|uniref:HhH-GPD base excision DNA repair family protein n=1 Tax=Hibiscus syriacus TaxID=106335 RepID=A0A6A3D0X5_HIBSY|nr:putative HhH-GPD base excision DNA repair family protein [Hibiscus syriacus]
MASLCCNNQVRDFCFRNANYGRSCSKAQACLSKILHLISTIPPPCEKNPNKRGFDIDLNLRLGSSPDGESEDKSESLAENSFVGENPDGDGDDEEEIQEKTATATEVSSDLTEMHKCEVKTAATARLKDSLNLLIEAAEMISGGDYSADEKDEGSQVVRSKRGRCQVLPHRFRDSVLEPWKKRPQRSAAMASTKRRK